ncbi:MAG TPA: hypothetical protein VHD56_14125 [Tepidisphaeraceae bacterium]|nr:hypothetical protein [Tepidisphaeraceae bacterium]
MVIAYHATFTAYGFWLSNDQRGNWSDFIRSWDLFLTGGPTKTSDQRSQARKIFDSSQRQSARYALRYDPARFDSFQIETIGKGIERAAMDVCERRRGFVEARRERRR